MHLKAKWKGKVNGKDVSGHVSIPSFDSDDWPDDIEIDISAEKTDENHREARQYIPTSQPSISSTSSVILTRHPLYPRYMKSVKSNVMKQLEIFYNELQKK